MNTKSNSENQPCTIDDIMNEIKQKSPDGDYIYRGERKEHSKISSSLYREYIKIRDLIEIDVENFDFDLRIVEKEMLKVAKKHIGGPPKRVLDDSADDRSAMEISMADITIAAALQRVIAKNEEDEEIEILTELQHYGGKTNLIDFTTDFLIAIFFACAGDPKEDGRVIVLQHTQDIKNMVIRPQNPERRVIAQKSVFLHPPNGFIDVSESQIVTIPKTLKENFLKYLRKHHGIFTETIYNDIHGFITNQNIQRNAYIQFYLGLTLQYRGYHAEPGEEKQQAYKDAISHYNQVIELNSEISDAYGNRGECWLHLKNWDKAKEDFTIVQDMGYDIVDAFRNDYKGGVEEFEEKTGIEMPKDIAVLLGG